MHAKLIWPVLRIPYMWQCCLWYVLKIIQTSMWKGLFVYLKGVCQGGKPNIDAKSGNRKLQFIHTYASFAVCVCVFANSNTRHIDKIRQMPVKMVCVSPVRCALSAVLSKFGLESTIPKLHVRMAQEQKMENKQSNVEYFPCSHNWMWDCAVCTVQLECIYSWSEYCIHFA